MAAWFTVYCSRSVEHVTVAEIQSEINGWDFHTAAEMYGIDSDEVVDQALASLKLDRDDGTDGVRFRLTYGQPGFRPILIHIWSDPERIEEEREEAEERLARVHGDGKEVILSHLGRIVEVVALELGLGQLEDMGVVLAGMVSEYLARVGDGLILDPYNGWWAIENDCPVQLARAE